MTIEMAKASAMAAFRAGRTMGHREALSVLVDMMNDVPMQGEKRLLMDACERISALAKEPTNDRNLPRDPAAEAQAERETAALQSERGAE